MALAFVFQFREFVYHVAGEALQIKGVYEVQNYKSARLSPRNSFWLIWYSNDSQGVLNLGSQGMQKYPTERRLSFCSLDIQSDASFV